MPVSHVSKETLPLLVLVIAEPETGVPLLLNGNQFPPRNAVIFDSLNSFVQYYGIHFFDSGFFLIATSYHKQEAGIKINLQFFLGDLSRTLRPAHALGIQGDQRAKRRRGIRQRLEFLGSFLSDYGAPPNSHAVQYLDHHSMLCVLKVF